MNMSLQNEEERLHVPKTQRSQKWMMRTHFFFLPGLKSDQNGLSSLWRKRHELISSEAYRHVYSTRLLCNVSEILTMPMSKEWLGQ
ncbi:hypothetical protein CapIbe_015893 [Capra ibex]